MDAEIDVKAVDNVPFADCSSQPPDWRWRDVRLSATRYTVRILRPRSI